MYINNNAGKMKFTFFIRITNLTYLVNFPGEMSSLKLFLYINNFSGALIRPNNGLDSLNIACRAKCTKVKVTMNDRV